MQGGSILGRESRCLRGFALDFESVPSTLTSVPRLGLLQLPQGGHQQLLPVFSLTFWRVLLQCKQILLSRHVWTPTLITSHSHSSRVCHRQVQKEQQGRGMRGSVSHSTSVARRISTPMNLGSSPLVGRHSALALVHLPSKCDVWSCGWEGGKSLQRPPAEGRKRSVVLTRYSPCPSLNFFVCKMGT